MINQATGLVTDQDIIDTIAEKVARATWGEGSGAAWDSLPKVARERLITQSGEGVAETFAALDAAGYAVVPRDEIDTLWAMLVDREQTIDGEWGRGKATDEELLKELEDELALTLHRQRAEEGK